MTVAAVSGIQEENDLHAPVSPSEERYQRKLERDASYQSLSELDVVLDFLSRRIEVKLDNKLQRGTIDSFDEDCHRISFDAGAQCWFALDIDNLTESGYAQQMKRENDGSFSEVGERLPGRLV